MLDIYSNKLLKSFDLILNHTVDNRDDTIILKLIDQLSEVLNDVYSIVINFVQVEIFEKSYEIIEKDSEIQQFCLNLLNCIAQKRPSESFEKATLSFLEIFLKDKNFFDLDPGTLCSAFQLLLNLNLNDNLKALLFSEDSIFHFLDPDLKSIYLRNNFKKLLIKYLSENEVKLVILALPDRLKMANLDIFYNGKLKIDDLESKINFIDLKSIDFFAKIIIQDLDVSSIESLSDKLKLLPTQHNFDLSQKFLLYALESKKGDIQFETAILNEFFKPFKNKTPTKIYIYNLNLLLKKFDKFYELADYLDLDNLFYLLKSLNLDSKIKEGILKFILGYFESGRMSLKDEIFLKNLNETLINVFKFRVDGEISEECLKLVSLESEKIEFIYQQVNFKALNELNLERFINLSLYLLKKDKFNQPPFDFMKKCVDILSEPGDFEIKHSILGLFCEINYFDETLFDSKLIRKIQTFTLGETEAFLRREYLKFLTNFSLKRNLKVLINEYFSYIVKYEHDWECQLICLNYFEKTIQNNLRNKDTVILSEGLECLIKALDDPDQQVVKKSCEILLWLKKKEIFTSKISEIVINKIDLIDQFKDDLSNYSLNLAVGCEDNYSINFNQVFKELKIEYLEKRLVESSQTSDLYSLNRMAILDDIISSYQFDWNDEKSVDCY
ncbi:unnamed protein product [Brachionus calyciflorus]|uniref:Uncharacterized protein n=2 Tax=Brachionus calyciflorus TaxID=104777 RepID=A0A814AQ98_9BILA|nr:unnamed protein product [Brachionus calyciflorus]